MYNFIALPLIHCINLGKIFLNLVPQFSRLYNGKIAEASLFSEILQLSEDDETSLRGSLLLIMDDILEYEKFLPR